VEHLSAVADEPAHARLLADPVFPADVSRLELILAPVVVFDRCHLGVDRDVEVVVEVAPQRRRPRERPPHAIAIGKQPLQWRPRDRDQRHVVVLKMEADAFEPVRDRRATRAPLGPVGTEHEVVDDELRSPREEAVECRLAPLGRERVVLLDRDPRQRGPLAGQLVASFRELLLLLE